jgi:hypothetical protein
MYLIIPALSLIHLLLQTGRTHQTRRPRHHHHHLQPAPLQYPINNYIALPIFALIVITLNVLFSPLLVPVGLMDLV